MKINLFTLYLFQLKEYRRDRLYEFVNSPYGKKVLRNKHIFIYTIMALFYIIDYLFFHQQFLFKLTQGLLIIFSIDFAIIVYKFLKGTTIYPHITKRIILLGLGAILIQTGIIVWGRISQHIILSILIVILSPYIVVLIVNIILLPLIQYKKNKLISTAKQKMQKFNNLISIGITGSFGKSSVKTLLVELLHKHFNLVATPENINTEMGVSGIIMKKIKKDHELFIAEMGAYQIGEIDLLGQIVQHTHGFITGIGNQHIGLFGSQNNIRKGKLEITHSVKLKGGNLYVNADSVQHLGNDIISYSIKHKTAKAYSKITKISPTGIQFRFHYQDNIRDLSTNLIGAHQILNLTGVLACCYDLGIPPSKLTKSLMQLTPPKNTLQIKKINKHLTIIDDSYNLSVDGLRAGVEFLQQFTGTKILVLDDILELGKNSKKIHTELGTKLIDFKLDKIFLIGKNYAHHIKQSLIDAGYTEKNILQASQLTTQIKGIILFEGRGTQKFIKKFIHK